MRIFDDPGNRGYSTSATSHIQIAVRDPASILGYFKPRQTT